MRRKFVFTTAICLCLVLAFGSAMAGSRDRDGSADRGKRERSGSGAVAIDYSAEWQYATATNKARVETAGNAALRKAQALLGTAGDANGDVAIQMLNEVLSLDLPDTPETDKVLAATFDSLAEHYAHAPQKQVHYFGMSLQYTRDPGRRTWLHDRINDMGGDAVAVAFGANPSFGSTSDNPSPSTVGLADTCLEAQAVTLDWIESGLTIEPGGDHDWYVFDVTGTGAILRIETITDQPGTGADDTDLRLCDSTCTDGTGDGLGPGFCDGTQLAFNDDSPLANDVFMSRIDTDCLPPDTYQLAVGGFADSAGADNFTLEIAVTTACVPPAPDDFEPDDRREEASRIGNPFSSSDPSSMLNANVAQEVQAHSIFPPGDQDWMKFSLSRNEQVRMETACGFPTIFNDFDPGCDTNPDTILELRYTSERDYGGICNSISGGALVGDLCLDDDDCDANGNGDCFDDLINPAPGFPCCITWDFINPASHPFRPPDQPLAANDDVSFPSNVGSRLDICLPLTDQALTPAISVATDPLITPDGTQLTEFDWYIKVEAFSSTDNFNYEVLVQNQAVCDYECEPNNGLGRTANPICLGGTVNGIFEFREYHPFQDADVFAFDVVEEALVVFETSGYSNTLADTAFELFVGPDNNGDFFDTGITDDDGGDGFFSRLDLILPPAADLLGITPPLGCEDVNARCIEMPGGGTGDDDDDDDSAGTEPDPTATFIQCDRGTPPAGDDDDDDDSAGGPTQPEPPLCPAYYLNVTSFFLNANFPYQLFSEIKRPPFPETEPNDDCMTNAETIEIGDTVLSAIDPTCDFDTYKLSLTGPTAISIGTVTTGDSSMELRDCATDTRLCCDDDGGPGLASLITGCLDAGDYCVRVRAFSGFSTFAYNLEVNGSDGCAAGDLPGDLTCDEAFRCDDNPPGEFDTCPN